MPLPKPKSDFSVSASMRALIGLGILAATFTLMISNALAEDSARAHKAPTIAANTVSPMVQAVKFGRAGENNIAVMLYYGTGNRTPPGRAGQMVVDAVKRAGKRAQFPVNAQYYYMKTDLFEGIAVDFAMGGVSIEGIDIRQAIKQPSAEQPHVITDKVVQKRMDVNRLIELAK